jgi:hypothetical protein
MTLHPILFLFIIFYYILLYLILLITLMMILGAIFLSNAMMCILPENF